MNRPKPHFLLHDITVCDVPIPPKLQGGITLPVLTYVLLVDHIREHGADVISPSLAGIGRELGCAPTAAGAAITRLVNLGVIGRIRPGKTHLGVTYTLTDESALEGLS
jgi:DNA-binding transcriptional regulator PaaX